MTVTRSTHFIKFDEVLKMDELFFKEYVTSSLKQMYNKGIIHTCFVKEIVPINEDLIIKGLRDFKVHIAYDLSKTDAETAHREVEFIIKKYNKFLKKHKKNMDIK